MNEERDFLNLDRIQWLLLLLALIAVGFAVNVVTLLRISAVADQGAQSLAASCSYKAYLEHQAQESEKFLRLTPSQIRILYGPGFTKIPRATIRQNLAKQQAAVAALHSLSCGEGG